MDPVSAGQLQAAVGKLQNGQVQEAKAQLNALRLKFPKHADVEHMLAMAAKTEGQYDQAEAHFLSSLKASPEQPVVLSNLGNLYQQTENWTKAVDAYRKAVKLDQKFVNAWHNLTLVLCKTRKFGEAEKAAQSVKRLSGETVKVVSLLAFVQLQAGKPEEAQAIYKDALKKAPGNAQLWLAYAGLERAEGEFEEAAHAYEQAKSVNGANVELYLNLAEAYYELHQTDKAQACYQEALQAFPFDPQIHYAHARFLWEAKPEEDHLSAIKSAIPQQPNNIGLWGRYFDLLAHEGQFERILKGLSEAYRVGIKAPRLTLAEAVAESAIGNIDQANQLFEELLLDETMGHASKLMYVEHLLKTGDAKKAESLCQAVLDVEPNNVRAWAFIGTAWKLLQDNRENWLLDYEQMVRPVDVAAPEGYPSQEAFFQEVREELEALHRMQAHPIDQTVQGGTQTNGNLFRSKSPVLQKLKMQIREAIEKTIVTFPDQPDHPFWGKKRDSFDFSGAWSVRLRNQGFHTNHYHPEGWISSALYISLPEEVSAGLGTDGHIQFGQPVAEMGLEIAPSRIVEPKVGRLVLFPSYMWHGTIPFSSDQPRITVAFDVVPV